MIKKHYLSAIAFLLVLSSCSVKQEEYTSINRIENFNNNWEFVKDIDSKIDSSFFSKSSALMWEDVSIPHTAQIEPLVIKGKQWQGICYYRKFFTIQKADENKHLTLKFEGAMQVAEIYLNGQLLKTNYGGYLPFTVDLSGRLEPGKENCLLVKLDNMDNPQVPPGKPLATLDFNYYGGIYRNVWLISENKLHITNAVDAGKIASGGIFIRFSEVSEQLAKIRIDVDVENSSSIYANAYIVATLIDKNGNEVQTSSSEKRIEANKNIDFQVGLDIATPYLWSPESPYLYKLKINLYKGDLLIGSNIESVGIRSFNFSAIDGFVLNGKKVKLRGTNRHQEYPYIGYALSDNANYRDAYKIKQAGFNFVRLSHYPHSESFMRACDELGLLVMDAIPGWQFFGDSIFQENAISDIRKMIRRDRNHPSVILWEASLNESGMTSEFMQKAHETVHEEFPGENVYTCGWIDEAYDVYIPARQHAKPPYYWNKYVNNKPLFIAEYGDWEYYAQNAGFNQKEYKNLSDEERNSRQLRAFGQKRLAQQALNYQEAHNDNQKGNAVGDANWLMFDYNRGYAPDIEASGIMDIFRLPKFAFYFYQSQSHVNNSLSGDFNKPMIAIANYYNDPSFYEIKIYSNCDEVELLLNGKLIEKRKPDSDQNSTNLLHPPFTFKLNDYAPGVLKANGYINGKLVVKAEQSTPGNATGLKLWIDESGKSLEKSCNDVVFLHAAVVDNNGTIVPDATNRIKFTVSGDAELIGNNPIETEAGVASILLKAGERGGEIEITAFAEGLQSKDLKIIAK